MKAVWKKEVRMMMTTLIAPLMCAVILAVIVLYFIFHNLIDLNADIATPMNAASVLALTFAVPFLTMRSFAEEKRTKTDQLLFTSPVRTSHLVFGKYLALISILLIPALIACLLPLILMPYGSMHPAYSYTAVFGFFLYGMMLTSIGLFLSSLTMSPAVSGILTFFVILLGVLLGSAYTGIGVGWLKNGLSACFDFTSRIGAMMGGTFSLTSVVYFLSITGLFLFLTVFVCKQRMRQRGDTSAASVIRLTVPVIAAVLITVTVNLVTGTLPLRIRSFDVTSNGLYSVSDASRAVLGTLEDAYTLYYLAPEDASSGKDENIERILRSFDEASGKVTLRYINPYLQPYFYAAYSDRELSLNSVIVENDATGEALSLDMFDLVKAELDTSSLTSYITGYDVEGQITGAMQLLSVNRTEAYAYIVTGHDEIPFDNEFLARFSRVGLSIQTIDLSVREIPEDAAMVIVNEPLTDYSQTESERLLHYLQNGGNLFFNAAFREDAAITNLNRILSYYGVTLLKGLVIEQDPQGYYYSGTEAAPAYLFPLVVHDEMTKDVTGEVSGSVFAPLCQSFVYEKKDGIRIMPLLVTSEEAFLKTDLTKATYDPGPEDLCGRQIVGLKCEVEEEGDVKGRAVLYASNGIFTNEADTQVSMGMNARLFVNTLNELMPDDAAYTYIPPKMFYQPLAIRANSAIEWSVALSLLPLLIIVCGVIVFLRRRRL